MGRTIDPTEDSPLGVAAVVAVIWWLVNVGVTAVLVAPFVVAYLLFRRLWRVVR